MGKKVRVLTKCGVVHVYDHDQDIETIEIIEEESIFNEPKCSEDVRKMVEFLHGGKWRFSTNTEDSTYEQLKGWTNTTPENVVIVPWAFYGSYRNKGCFNRRSGPYKDDVRLTHHNSVWVRSSTGKAINDG